MRKRDYLAAVGILLVSVACGQAPQSSVPVGGLPNPQSGMQMPTCQAGQIALGYACLPTTDLTQACYMVGGAPISINGTLTCRYKLYYPYSNGKGVSFNPTVSTYTWYSYGYQFARLNPSDPMAYSAFNPEVYVRKGDKLTFKSDGSWGTSYPSQCTTFGMDTSRSYDGVRSGTMGSDGVEAFYLGTSATKTINNDGALRLGINADPAYTNACGKLRIVQLQIQRCQDASGGTYVCP